MNRRQALTGFAATAAAAVLVSPERASAHGRDLFPTTIPLPNGWRPEGIAIGNAPFAYFGSLADGSIYRANLVTGAGAPLREPGPGTMAVGLKLDGRGRLFVAGGGAGNGRVVSASSGRILASYAFTTEASFVNDVVLTPRAAYFTDSTRPFLYVVPLGHGGRLPASASALPLTGDLVYVAGFNVNGIARTPDGRGLLVVQSNTASLFRVNPATGATRLVDLGGEPLTAGDGLLVEGRTLFVVQNQLNRVAVFRLSWDGLSGRLVTTATDPGFDIPTTVASFGRRLYLPNARFSTPPTPETTYTAVAIPRP